jgi:hypothetical protein
MSEENVELTLRLTDAFNRREKRRFSSKARLRSPAASRASARVRIQSGDLAAAKRQLVDPA